MICINFANYFLSVFVKVASPFIFFFFFTLSDVQCQNSQLSQFLLSLLAIQVIKFLTRVELCDVLFLRNAYMYYQVVNLTRVDCLLVIFYEFLRSGTLSSPIKFKYMIALTNKA